jgi:hypothetical protein
MCRSSGPCLQAVFASSQRKPSALPHWQRTVEAGGRRVTGFYRDGLAGRGALTLTLTLTLLTDKRRVVCCVTGSLPHCLCRASQGTVTCESTKVLRLIKKHEFQLVM